MQNFLVDIKNLKSELKQKEEILKLLVSQIKKEMSDSCYQYECSIKNTFRFAMMLIFSEYSGKYDDQVVRNYKINASTNLETKDYNLYYDIFKASSFNYGWAESHDIVGFICFKKDLHHALEHQFQDLWKYSVVNERYIGSLQEFKELYAADSDKLYEIFNGYIQRKDKQNQYLWLVNYPSLKIKDVVIHIKSY